MKPFRLAFEDLALNRKRRHLKLQRMALTKREMQFLALFLQCGNQLSLNLSFNLLSEDMLRPIKGHLSTHPRLHTLNLAYTSIGDDGLAVVAAALRTNANITDVDLGAAGFGIDGCVALADMLAVNTSLKRLYLPFNDLEKEGAAALAPGIAHNTGLEELNLRCNFFGPLGATSIAKALEINNGRLTNVRPFAVVASAEIVVDCVAACVGAWFAGVPCGQLHWGRRRVGFVHTLARHGRRGGHAGGCAGVPRHRLVQGRRRCRRGDGARRRPLRL